MTTTHIPHLRPITTTVRHPDPAVWGDPRAAKLHAIDAYHREFVNGCTERHGPSVLQEAHREVRALGELSMAITRAHASITEALANLDMALSGGSWHGGSAVTVGELADVVGEALTPEAARLLSAMVEGEEP